MTMAKVMALQCPHGHVITIWMLPSAPWQSGCCQVPRDCMISICNISCRLPPLVPRGWLKNQDFDTEHLQLAPRNERIPSWFWEGGMDFGMGFSVHGGEKNSSAGMEKRSSNLYSPTFFSSVQHWCPLSPHARKGTGAGLVLKLIAHPCYVVNAPCVIYDKQYI